MKINTDGTLLGVLSAHSAPVSILDVGAGTGVVALMLAQRYPGAFIDAVEIDQSAALTANLNFKGSAFAERLTLYPSSFQEFSISNPSKKYDLIVSNPPFFIDSLKSATSEKQTARHANKDFFVQLLSFAASHLSPQGILSLILPLETASVVMEIAHNRGLFTNCITSIRSFPESAPHRKLLNFAREPGVSNIESDFVIYSSQKVYSDDFVNKLKDFFLIL